jgi:hypothetical protein
MALARPIVYVRGYAGTQSDVDETVDDPTYGFNTGSTHIRQSQDGKADMFMFVSPFARLFRDHDYKDVIDGAVQRLPPRFPNPERTVWIYRYYDPTSNTFDRPGGRRLSVDEAAAGLRDFIKDIQTQVREAKRLNGDISDDDAPIKVYLVAHSMGGLICRCLIQKIYPPGEAERNIDKLFTYGTPHGGIHFDIAGGRLVEKLRDMVGYHDSDNFGPRKMYESLTRKPKDEVPTDFEPRSMDADSFNTDRVFCVIGTNAEDYAVAAGLSRAAVGPQSDGLVQIDNAYVLGAHRAYIHRSHSGRYGMVNSAEAYQNLRRFLFGDIKVKALLTNFTLDYSDNHISEIPNVSYFFETQVAIRGLPILMHERTLRHYSGEAIDEATFKARYSGETPNQLPLFTTFLFQSNREDGTIRFMLRIALFKQQYQKEFLVFGDHMERLPLWSDYLMVQLKDIAGSGQPVHFDANYCWVSEKSEPDVPLLAENADGKSAVAYFKAPLPKTQSSRYVGTDAAVRFEASPWN